MDRSNPYLEREAIRDINQFYGRKQEIARIYSRIGAPNPQSVSIVGDRYTGKSSLLHSIYHDKNRRKYLDDAEDYVFVFMDLREEPNDSVPDLIGSLVRLVSEVLGPDFTPVEARSGSIHTRTEYDTLKRLAMALRHERRKLIVLFDEFKLITQNEAFNSRFYAFLRALASNYDISFVTSSTRDLHDLCSAKSVANSPFFNIFSKIHLGPFNEAEAVELIEKPSSEAGCPLSKYTGSILSMSGLLPVFIQMACSAFLEYIKSKGRIKDDSHIAKIEEIFFKEAEPYFRYIWNTLDSDARGICRAVRAGDSIEEDSKNVLIDLIRRGYVLDNVDNYSLFSTTFASRIVDDVETISK